jgi:tetratricopeptide (TPR) repeat protein
MAAYDAFISYSHAKDKPIANALQSVTQKLGKPWYRRRSLRIFRDDTSLSATPGLWPAIEQALGQSRFLLLLASPEAASSPWVDKEVAYWRKHKSAGTVLIALTGGDLTWDARANDFAWTGAAPLPPALKGAFEDEPKWVDLRAYRDGANPRDARFAELAADFAAAIHGMPKEDLLSQELRQQRRALSLAWSAAGVLLVLAGLAGWQWSVATEQKKIALEQRDRAERSLDVATNAANSMVLDLARAFRDRSGMPADLVRLVLDRARDLQRRLTDSGETALKLKISEAAVLTELMETLLSLGDTKKAAEFAQQAVFVMDWVAAKDPQNHSVLRNRALTYAKLSRALIQAGQRDKALDAARRSLALSQSLAALSSDSALYQIDIATAHAQIAHLLKLAGNREAAIAASRESVDVAEKLVAKHPDDREWRKALAARLGELGDLLFASGKPDDIKAALEVDQRSFELFKQLAVSDSSNTRAQANLAIAHGRNGHVLSASGRREEALADFREAKSIYQTLVASDTGNTEWQHDLAGTLDSLGTALAAMDKQDEAIAEFRAALAINESFAGRDAGNPDWRRNIAMAYFKIGRALSAQGKNAEAFDAANKALEIRQGLSALDQGNVQWQTDRALSYELIGNVQAALDKHEEALAAFREAVALGEKASAKDPNNDDWRRKLSQFRIAIGDELMALGKPQEALVEYRASLAMREAFAAEAPRDDLRQYGIWEAHMKIGKALAKLGEREQALEAYQRALAVTRHLAASAPPSDAWWVSNEAGTYEKIGDLLLKSDKAAAQENYARALKVREARADANPDKAQLQIDLVILLSKLADAGGEPTENRTRARSILRKLEASGQLSDKHKGSIATLSKHLDRASQQTADAPSEPAPQQDAQ